MKKAFSVCCAFLFSMLAFALPNGYSDIKLGMSVEEVKAVLEKKPEFGYRGERDVSFAPSRKTKDESKDVIIETDASFANYSFFQHCWFQFAGGKLRVITLNLDSTKVDHYTVFKKLCDKYGNPQEITPQRSIWRNSQVQFSLERPLVLKYIDKQSTEEQKAASGVEKTNREKLRDNFLDAL